jgi:hypothetical protein
LGTAETFLWHAAARFYGPSSMVVANDWREFLDGADLDRYRQTQR